MTRKSPVKELRSFEIEGNKGGSFFRIEETATDGIISLTIGHDCVHVFQDRQISVFALCAILAEAWDGDGFRKIVAKHCGGEIPKWAEPIPEEIEIKFP